MYYSVTVKLMKLRPLCIQCIINVRFREILNAVNDEEKTIKIQIELLRTAYEVFRDEQELTKVATRIFSWLVEALPEVKQYYTRVKRDEIIRAKKIVSKYREFLQDFSGYEQFRIAAKISIAGNLLDTGVRGYEPPREILIEHILSTPITIDHTRQVYTILSKGGKNILWLFDNAGEAILDTVIIDLLRRYGNKVIGVAKEEPGFQNDLTISDAEYAGLNEYVDKIISTGCNEASIHLESVSEEFKQVLKDSDIIVAKGMAHFEYLSTLDLNKPVLFLLVPKCQTLSNILGLPRGTYVALYRS